LKRPVGKADAKHTQKHFIDLFLQSTTFERAAPREYSFQQRQWFALLEILKSVVFSPFSERENFSIKSGFAARFSGLISCKHVVNVGGRKDILYRT